MQVLNRIFADFVPGAANLANSTKRMHRLWFSPICCITWNERHPQNRKLTYANAAKAGLSHGQRTGNTSKKLCEIRICGFPDKRADRQTYRQADRNTLCVYWGWSNNNGKQLLCLTESFRSYVDEANKRRKISARLSKQRTFQFMNKSDMLHDRTKVD